MTQRTFDVISNTPVQLRFWTNQDLRNRERAFPWKYLLSVWSEGVFEIGGTKRFIQIRARSRSWVERKKASGQSRQSKQRSKSQFSNRLEHPHQVRKWKSNQSLFDPLDLFDRWQFIFYRLTSNIYFKSKIHFILWLNIERHWASNKFFCQSIV